MILGKYYVPGSGVGIYIEAAIICIIAVVLIIGTVCRYLWLNRGTIKKLLNGLFWLFICVIWAWAILNFLLNK